MTHTERQALPGQKWRKTLSSVQPSTQKQMHTHSASAQFIDTSADIILCTLNDGGFNL